MKKQLLSAILLIMLVIASGITSGCPTGGGCQYKDYEGVITIKEVRRQSDKTSAPESPEEKLFIFYTFKTDVESPSQVSNFSENMELTRKQIEQKGIKIGKQFQAKANYIERGSCNPGPNLEKFENWR